MNVDWKVEAEEINNLLSNKHNIRNQKPILSKNESTSARVLIITDYMMFPFTAGGILRTMSPLIGMPGDDRVKVDIIFSSLTDNHGKYCAKHLKEINVMKNVYYSIKDYVDVKNCNLPSDVVDTLSNNLLGKIIQLITNEYYDVIQIEHSQLSWLVPFIRINSPNSKVILDEHNIEYRIYEKWLEYDDSNYVRNRYDCLKQWEEKVWPWYDAIMTVSEVESKIIRDLYPNLNVVFLTVVGIHKEKYDYIGEQKEYDIIYIGSQDWVPNVHGLIWFINNVFPIIEKTRPGTKFHIMGGGVSHNELVRASHYSKNILLTGFCEDDVETFHKSKVLVVPLFIGAGARVKIPIAMATSIPIVSTTFGAEGSGAVNGVNILLADDPVDFAGHVLKILEDEAFSNTIISNAKKFVDDNYSIENMSMIQKNLYLEISGKKS